MCLTHTRARFLFLTLKPKSHGICLKVAWPFSICTLSDLDDLEAKSLGEISRDFGRWLEISWVPLTCLFSSLCVCVCFSQRCVHQYIIMCPMIPVLTASPPKTPLSVVRYGATFSDVTIVLTLMHGDVNKLPGNKRMRSKIGQVTWIQVTCEVTFEMRERKLHKLLGFVDEAFKLLDQI